MDEEMRLAIAMSLAESNPTPTPDAAAPATNAPPAAENMWDPAYVDAVLRSLPGADTTDPRVQVCWCPKGCPEI
jgi:predicted glycoside hydrolase/deacetylase ChbG (UPF0249 family)